jgi:hypothetical protein
MNMSNERRLYDGAMNELGQRLMPASVIGEVGHLRCLGYLVETIIDGLSGKLKPVIYVASIDPGLGKTLAAITVLRQWKHQGFYPQSSVLIFVKSKDEIKTYISSIGLDPHEFAVVTTDKGVNDMGCPTEEHSDAPIMFTTQKMLKSRSNGRSFSSLKEFHYQGKQRTLLLWDESIEVGDWSVVDLSKFASARSALPRGNDDLDSQLFEFEALARKVKETSLVTVPESLKSAKVSCFNKAANKSLATIQSLAGNQVLLVVSEDGHRSLVRPKWSLPSDMKPLIVLDASARLRQQYGLMNDFQGELLGSPPLIRDYSNLNVNIWKRGCGKSALSRTSVITNIAKEVAHLINQSNGGDWLIVHYKDYPQVVEATRGYISEDVNATIHSTHWGKHTATNEFSHVSNVVLIGQPTYPEENYRTQCYAAAGGYYPDNTLPTLTRMKVSEYQHHYLQAACRGSIRSGKHCNLYVVVTPTPDVYEWLSEAFPLASIIKWTLSHAPLKGRAEKAIEYLIGRLSDQSVNKVTKKEVREHLGMSAPNFSNQVVKVEGFSDALKNEGLQMGHNFFERQPPMFEPDDGDFDAGSL